LLGEAPSYFDWSCKVDLKKNAGRSVQTKPFPVGSDGKQFWAFIIDLGSSGWSATKQNEQSQTE